ncbi:hypothetical protein CPB83DRAFT_865179 [Crepidotus variabilis]|uniref:Uncharacterized protein n=1 Tax=Crepidotus variabilis TaxID=179855 RepID=A0A9P6JI52_9AGAR|nr:hypothetical protein CPB83DRAFT_865179 [Crepidotus variabilis]
MDPHSIAHRMASQNLDLAAVQQEIELIVAEKDLIEKNLQDAVERFQQVRAMAEILEKRVEDTARVVAEQTILYKSLLARIKEAEIKSDEVQLKLEYFETQTTKKYQERIQQLENECDGLRQINASSETKATMLEACVKALKTELD